MNDDYVIYIWLLTAIIFAFYVLVLFLTRKKDPIKKTQKECDALIAQANKKLRQREDIERNGSVRRRWGDL
tara:strand:+ start:4445 stop:4657 length:213 start_codon:yes stop_codon:yes gene_type:complete